MGEGEGEVRERVGQKLKAVVIGEGVVVGQGCVGV